MFYRDRSLPQVCSMHALHRAYFCMRLGAFTRSGHRLRSRTRRPMKKLSKRKRLSLRVSETESCCACCAQASASVSDSEWVYSQSV